MERGVPTLPWGITLGGFNSGSEANSAQGMEDEEVPFLESKPIKSINC